MSKHFLYLTNDKLVALVWKGGAIVSRDIFLANDAESSAFVEYVSRHRNIPTYFIVDLIEEDFRLDTIPHLRGSDADAVMTRKLSQLYRGTTFRHSIIQGREEEGRRDDKVLYHAITNPELLKPWLAELERARVPLEGIYSSPVLSALLAKDLNVFTPHMLLVTIIPEFGLRQTYFQNKQIKFSRLTQIIYDENKSVGALIVAEISRTWQYLDSLRFFTGGESLEVCMLIHERDKPMVTEATRSFPLLAFRFLDISEVAAKLKLKPAPTSSHAEEVLTHVFAQASLENHFAEHQEMRFAIFRRARIGLFAFTAAALAVGAGGAVFNLYEASQVSNEVSVRTRVAAGMRNEYQSISTEMLKETAASDTVRDASIFYGNQIRPQPASPVDFLSDLAGVLSKFPKVQLLQISWATSHDAAMAPAFTAIVQGGALAVRSKMNSPLAAGAAAQPAALRSPAELNPPLPGNKVQVGIIEAEISAFSGDFRMANAEINRFVDAINQTGSFAASVVSLPLDTQTSTTIQGDLDDRANSAKAAPFVIRLVRMARLP